MEKSTNVELTMPIVSKRTFSEITIHSKRPCSFKKELRQKEKRTTFQFRLCEDDKAILEFCVTALRMDSMSEFVRFLIMKQFEEIVQERETESLLNPLPFVVVENQKEEQNEQNLSKINEHPTEY